CGPRSGHFPGGGTEHLGGHEVDLGVVGGLDAALDAQHLSHRVLVSVVHLKILPRVPEVRRNLQRAVGGTDLGQKEERQAQLMEGRNFKTPTFLSCCYFVLCPTFKAESCKV
ncbi:unnamed protein product, partial [Ixodes pacificus]